MVGLIPLYGCVTLTSDMMKKLPAFTKRVEWFMSHRPSLASQVTVLDDHTNGSGTGAGAARLLALPSLDRMLRLLDRLFDEDEFLAPYLKQSRNATQRKQCVGDFLDLVCLSARTMHPHAHDASYVQTSKRNRIDGDPCATAMARVLSCKVRGAVPQPRLRGGA